MYYYVPGPFQSPEGPQPRVPFATLHRAELKMFTNRIVNDLAAWLTESFHSSHLYSEDIINQCGTTLPQIVLENSEQRPEEEYS